MKLFHIPFILILFYTTNLFAQTNTPFSKGDYTHSSFQSTSRGKVDFNVYLPSNWSKESTQKYPLIILLHGQYEDEFRFLSALPAYKLNNWIDKKEIPNTVIIALRGAENTSNMQWFTKANETMITSDKEGELREYCARHFNTTKNSNKISLIGHSRGATGALNFALHFPDKFAAVVASAFVSDYAMTKLKNGAINNQQKIIKSGIKIKMILGTRDDYVEAYNRKGSPTMSALLKKKGIDHELEMIKDKSHSLPHLWESPTDLKCLKFCTEAWE